MLCGTTMEEEGSYPSNAKAPPQDDQSGSLRPFDMSVQQPLERLGEERSEERRAGIKPQNKSGDWVRHFRRKTMMRSSSNPPSSRPDRQQRAQHNTNCAKVSPAGSQPSSPQSSPSSLSPFSFFPTFQGKGQPSPTSSPPRLPCARGPPGPSQR